jgi:hypothetical protein
VKIGDKYLRLSNAAVSADGAIMTFVVGGLFEQSQACNQDRPFLCPTPDLTIKFLQPVSPPPASQTGALTFATSGAGVLVTGPTVTWALGGPKMTNVYGWAWHGPFAELESELQPDPGYAMVEGTNLAGTSQGGQWKIGSTAVNAYDENGDGTRLLLTFPATASSGHICGTSNGVTACTSDTFIVFGGPSIANLPASPLSIGTTYTIDGINLRPPPEAEAAGLKYEFTMGGLWASNADAVRCNRVMKVLDHTQYHIVFRIGDPAVPVPAGCNVGDSFDPNSIYNLMILWGANNGYDNQYVMLPQRFYLAK